MSEICSDVGCNFLHLFGIRIAYLFLEIHVALLLQWHKMDVGVGNLKPENRNADFAARDSLLHGHGNFLGEDHHLRKLLVVDVEYIRFPVWEPQVYVPSSQD